MHPSNAHNENIYILMQYLEYAHLDLSIPPFENLTFFSSKKIPLPYSLFSLISSPVRTQIGSSDGMWNYDIPPTPHNPMIFRSFGICSREGLRCSIPFSNIMQQPKKEWEHSWKAETMQDYDDAPEAAAESSV
jgi:hypothetical protein